MSPIVFPARRRRAVRTLLALAALAALGACSSSPAQKNPHFAPMPQRPLALATDVIYFRDDAIGDTDAVDVDSSAAFARAIAERVSADLRARGYAAVGQLRLSSGVALDSSTPRVVVRHPQEAGAAPATVAVPAPFWVDSAALAARPALTTLYRSLREIARSKGNATNDRPPVVPYDARALGLPDSTRLLVLDVYARDVSTGKQVKQSILTAVATGGIVVAHTTSVMQVDLFAVEPSGAVTWIRRHAFKGGRGSREQVVKAVEKAVAELP